MEPDIDMPDMGSHLFDRLFTYLGKNTMKKEMETDYLEPELYQLKVDARSAGKVMSENWKTSINGGYAKGLLNEWVQKAVRRVQEDLRLPRLPVDRTELYAVGIVPEKEERESCG